MGSIGNALEKHREGIVKAFESKGKATEIIGEMREKQLLKIIREHLKSVGGAEEMQSKKLKRVRTHSGTQ